MGTGGTERGCLFVIRSVPIYPKQEVCVHATSWASQAESARTVNFAHISCHNELMSTSILGGVHPHQIFCYLFPLGRAVRSSRTRRRGATLLLPLPKYTDFLGMHGIYKVPASWPVWAIRHLGPGHIRNHSSELIRISSE